MGMTRRHRPIERRWSSAAAVRLMAAAPGTDNVDAATKLIARQLRASQAKPPTDLTEISLRLGVTRIERGIDMGVSGELVRDGEDLVIRYAEGISPGRRRFTIAHELGHAFFETTGPNWPRKGAELERICDLLAVELLMPVAWVEELVGLEPEPKAVLAMRDAFGVSLGAAQHRVREVCSTHSFVVHEHRGVTYSTGVPRQLDDSLSVLVKQTFVDEGIDIVTLMPSNRAWNGPWRLQGCVYGDRRHALFTVSPIVQG